MGSHVLYFYELSLLAIRVLCYTSTKLFVHY